LLPQGEAGSAGLREGLSARSHLRVDDTGPSTAVRWNAPCISMDNLVSRSS
jgi:hypothetical protein